MEQQDSQLSPLNLADCITVFMMCDYYNTIIIIIHLYCMVDKMNGSHTMNIMPRDRELLMNMQCK